MRPRRRVLLGSVVAAAAAAIAGGGWLLSRRGDDSLERVRRAGVLRVGYAVEAPYAMLGPGGEVTGESPETARRIAERLGLPRIEWVQVSFGELIPSLLEHRFDLIAAGLFVTAERARQVRFSEPTVRVLPGLLMRQASPVRPTDYRDLAAHAELRVAVLEGSVEQQRVQAMALAPSRVLVLPDAQAGRAALAAGTADVLLLSLPTVRTMAAGSGGRLQALADRSGDDAGPRGIDLVAFAFHPADLALLQAWNAAQAGWVGGAEHLRIVSRFGFEAAELVAAGAAAAPPRP